MLEIANKVFREALKYHKAIPNLGQYKMPPNCGITVPGECESFAYWCRRKLEEYYHLESELVLCTTESGEYHLVCSLDSLILDNRQNFVRRREDMSGYTWLYIGLPDGRWFEIKD